MPGRLRVNTALFSWEDCLFKVDNQQVTPSGNPWNIVALDYEEKRERKVVYTNRRSGQPRGKTRGKYSVASFSVKLLRAQSVELKQYLAQQAGNGCHGDALFTFTVQVSSPGVLGALPITVVANDCTWDGDKASHEEGIDELVQEVTIGALTMTENGLRLWSALDGPGA